MYGLLAPICAVGVFIEDLNGVVSPESIPFTFEDLMPLPSGIFFAIRLIDIFS